MWIIIIIIVIIIIIIIITNLFHFGFEIVHKIMEI